MIEIAIAIAIVIGIGKFAEEANQSTVVWGAIAGATMFVTVWFVSPDWAFARVMAAGVLLVVALIVTRIIRKE